MAGTCRKRKQLEREAPPLADATAGEALARAILALPPQPQPISCRVAGCQELLSPGYHKCGTFHGMEAFDSQYRSCRRSLARHQERRKLRHALQAAHGKKGKQARKQQAAQHALPEAQGSQPGEAGHDLHAQLLPLVLPSPPLEQPEQQEQAAAPKPRKARKPAKQHQPRQAAGKPLGTPAKQAAAAAAASCTEVWPSAEQPALPEQHSSEVHSAQAPQPPPAAAAPPAGSMQQVQQSDVKQPVTPPGQPGSHAARSAPAAEAASPWGPAHAGTLPLPPRQVLWSPLQQPPAAPPEAAWVQQPPAAPAASAWGQQQVPECGWMLINLDQRLAQAQPPLLPAAASEVQQPAGHAIWLVHQAQQDPSAGGGCSGSSSATYYPCYEPAMLQALLPLPVPVAPEQPAYSQFAEATACSASTAAAPLSPRINGAASSLQHCGSGVSTYLLAAPLSPHGRISAPARSPYHGAASTHGRLAFWVAASPSGASSLAAAPMSLEGCGASSSAPNQAWAQPAWQGGEQVPLLAAAAPRFAAQASLPLSQGLTPQPSLQPSLPLSQGLTPQPSLQPSHQPSPHAAPQHIHAPSPYAALPLSLQPSLPPAGLPSSAAALLPGWQDIRPRRPPSPPAAPLGCQQAEPWRQLQAWQADWAEDALVAPQPCCPQSPAVSWLNNF